MGYPSGGQTGEWALVQEEQMGPLLTPGKLSLPRLSTYKIANDFADVKFPCFRILN